MALGTLGHMNIGTIRTVFPLRTAAALLALLLVPLAQARPHWTDTLPQRLQSIDHEFRGELGVYVRDLDTGHSVSWRADEVWYLASGIKVLVAITAMRAVEAGTLALGSDIVLMDGDYVDGAGQTNLHPPGTALKVDYLIEQMLVHSDNTATDVLIRHLGLARVNQVAEELMPGHATITTLADVRRHAYSGFHDKAFELTSQNLLELRRARGEAARIDLLARLLGVSRSELALHDLDAAFDAYYATHLNAAPLTVFGRMLERLQRGEALGRDGTDYLLDVLARIETGTRRIKAGLPADIRFAHKTGTQHRRACDLGVASRGDRRLVIAACTRGEPTLAGSERALRAVGAAVAASGALDPITDPLSMTGGNAP